MRAITVLNAFMTQNESIVPWFAAAGHPACREVMNVLSVFFRSVMKAV